MKRSNARPAGGCLGGAVEDDGALLIVVLERVEAQSRANRGTRAVRGNDELRAHLALFAGLLDRGGHVPLVALHTHDFRRRERREPLRAAQPLPEHASQRLVLDRVAERRHTLLGGGNPRCTEAAALGDVNRANGLGIALELRPKTQAREDLLRAVRERRDARVEAWLRKLQRLLRFDEHGVERQLRERARQRRPDSATADDQHVAVAARGLRHAAPAMCRSISATVAGRSLVSTSGASRVTCTSSSIRIPMPRQRLSTDLSPAGT